MIPTGWKRALPTRTQISRWTVYTLFAGLFISLPAAVTISAPPSQAASFGTIYNAPEYFFGGGTSSGASDCSAGQVVVGITFNQNAMAVGRICAPLLDDYTIAALSTATRNTANYVFCPDGMAAVGTKYFSSSGLRAGLLCKTPPLVNDTGTETDYVASGSGTKFMSRTSQTPVNSLCNAGDLMVGIRYTFNLWLDSHGARCAPYVKFSISYNANNGVGAAPATVTQTTPNQDLTVTAYTGNRSGYRYAGWNTNANGTGTLYQGGDVQSNMTGNLALFAEWDSTITYDTNTATSGAVPPPTIARTSNAVTTLATNSGSLARTGYTFGGWNTRADGAGTNYAAGLTTYASPGDITLYAQWNSTITYSGNGNTSASGTIPSVKSMTGSAGQTYLLPAPTTLLRTNFTFAGWNTAANRSGTSYLPGETYTATGTTTLYAMWNLNISFNGTSPTSGATPSTITTNEFSSPTIPGNTGNLVKTGSTFVGWNTVSGGGGIRYLPGETITATGNMTLHAEWIQNCTPTTSYANSQQLATFIGVDTCAWTVPTEVSDIDFMIVGGGGGGGGNVGIGGAGGGVNTQRSIPVSAGQVVIKTLGGGGTGGASGANGTAGAATTLTINKTVYTAGGGAGGLAFANYARQANCAVTTNLPAAGSGGGTGGAGGRGGWGSSALGGAACSGYVGQTSTFSGNSLTYGSGGGGGGYSTGATPGAAGGAEAGAGGGPGVVSTAALANRGGGGGGGANAASGAAGGSGLLIIGWDLQSRITYDSNTAGSGVSTETITVQAVAGDTLTITSAGSLSRTGFTFAGWNTKSDATGTNYQPGDQLIPQGPLRLYAEWNYTVTYNGNNNSSDSSTVASAVLVRSDSSTITLDSAAALARTGYRLTGWNTLANGSGINYAIGATNWKSATGDITLYAQWSATISFNLNGADTGTAPSAVNTTGTGNGTFNLPSPTNVKKAGLTFYGWNTASNGSGTSYAAGASYTTTGAATLYAQFNAVLTYLANGASSGSAPSQVVGPASANGNGCKVETGYTHCRTYRFPTPKLALRADALNLEAIPNYINGTSWYDNSISGIVATANNSPTYDSVEKAWTLNGTNQYFNLGNVLNYTSGAFTVEVTFKPNSVTGTQALVSRYNSGVAGNYFMLMDGNKVKYSFEASPNVVAGPTSLSTGNRYTATQVFSGNSLATYLNGVSNGGTTTFGTSYASTVNLLIGAVYNNSSPTNFFNGKIYSVRIYNRALTAAEVASNYDATANPAPTNFDQTFVVPNNIPAGDKILVEAWGAGGGGVYHAGWTANGAGGAGGYAKSTITTTGNPETLTVVVGQSGEAFDLTPQYGGGGAGGLSPNAYKGSSGGGMSGIFSGSDTSTPLIIVGGGGGSSPGSAYMDGGGGGGSIGAGAGATYANRTGRGGTLIAGGAAATATTLCSIAPTAGSSQQGGRGAGHPSTANEGGGGGGGGLFGGGGGHCDASQSNGGGGGGSGYINNTRVTNIAAVVGATGIVTPATAPGGLNSINYSYPLGNGGDATIGVGFGGNGNPTNFYTAKGGDGMVVIHWNDPSDPWIASPNVNSMEKPGFRFTGWNTKADGTGTHYDTGTALERTNTTLYAEWSYRIQYDGNTNTSGIPPADQIATSGSPVTTIADNPNTLAKTGYFWDGWNNQSNGKGTNYSANSDLLGLPQPYMRYVAGDYNASTKVWVDSSGNGRNATSVRGTPTKTTSGAVNGFDKNFTTIRGTTSSGITLPNPKLNEYTLCFVARYAGATRARIFEALSENWLSGFVEGDNSGVAHHNAWITSSTGTKGDINWNIACDSGDAFRFNGVNKSTAVSTTKYLPASLSINAGLYGVQGYNSDWEVAEVITYDSYLTTVQMQQIESYFADIYGYATNGLLTGLPQPYMQYEASNYDADSKVWLDSSGNNRDATTVRGTPTVVTNAPANGSTKNVTAVKGGVTAGITMPNPKLDSYTLCYVARYAGANKGRIFDTFAENWLSGFYSGYNDLAVHNAWITPQSGDTSLNWKYNCDSGNNFRSNGIIRNNGTSTTTYMPNNLTINNNAGTGRETSDWEVAEILIYETATTSAQMQQIEGYLKSKYGLWTPSIATKRTTNFGSTAGDLTLYAQWNSYITYDSNTATSGRVPLPQLMVADTSVALSGNVGTLAKTGNSFLGWNTQANAQGTAYRAGDTYTVTANVTLFAQWGSSVTFDSNTATSGTSPSNRILSAGETLTLTSGTISKTGYTFAGWNTLANGSGTTYETGTTFSTNTNTILYAQWNSLIRFDVNGGTGSPNVDSVTAKGTVVVTLATAGNISRTGFTFNGWNTRADGNGTLYAAGLNTYTPAGNIILYAKWTGNPYTITYNGNGSTSGTTASKSITGGTPAAMTANGFLRTGYNFLGWAETNTATSSQYANGSTLTFFGNITLYAIWKPDVYTITYNSNGAAPTNVTFSQTFTSGQVPSAAILTAWQSFVSKLTASYSSFTFSSSNGGSITVSDPIKVTQLATALRTRTSSDASFSVVIGSNTWQYTPGYFYEFGNNGYGGCGTSNYVVRPSMINANWGGVGVVCNAGTQTLTIEFTLNNSVPVSIALGSPSKASETYTVGTTGVTLATVGTMVKQGYRFGGWATTPTGTTPQTSPYVASNTHTLYAIWTANQYKLFYDSNTATSGTLAPITFTAGTSFDLNGNLNFTKPGYTATGFNTAANGSGTFYAGGASVTFYDTTTVYSQWQPNAPAAPSITVVAGNASATVSVNGGILGTSNGPADSYTVTAKLNGVTVGSCVVLSPATSCNISGLTNNTAYSFTATSTNKTGTSVASTAVNGTPRGFVVTYNPVGGSVSPTTDTFTVGTPLVFPLATRSGYNFLGWFDTSTAGTNLGLNGGAFSPSESRTVFAQWQAIPYTITYFGNGNTSGSVPASGVYSLTSGNYAIANKNTLSKTGYLFNGWTSDTGTVFSVGSSYTRLANLNLYARWLAETYTVTYSANGGSGSVPIKSGTVTIGETFTAPSTSITLAGSSFAGWSDGIRTYLPGDVITVGGSNLTLTAVWNGTQYVVVYSLNGGTGSAPTSPNFYMSDTFTVASIGSVTKTGYTFTGWTESGTAYSTGATFTMPGRNINFIAQWAGLVYTITYATTGATSGSPTRTSDSFVYGGSAISLPTVGTMAKAGYIFDGWKETTTAISGAYSPSASVTLQPIWTPTTQILTFDANGATSGSAPSAATYTTDGTSVTAPGQGSLAKAGFTFGGWSDGTNTYAAGSAITGTSNKTLTAIWTPEVFAISYAVGTANNNPVTKPIGLPTTSATAYGSSFTLGTPETRTVTENSLVYAFAGWTNGGQTYQAGASVVMGTSAPTFTATWLRLYEVRYFMSGGVDTGMRQGLLYSNGASVTIDAAIPTRTGYTFAGWNDQSGNAVSGNTYSISDTNYLFYARWTANTYTLSYSSAGGSSAPNTVSATIDSVINIASATAITKSGYTFAGWSIAGSTYSGGAQYQFGASSETATALWTPTTQTITIDLAQGTSNTPISEPSRTIGETFAAPTALPTRVGYTFSSWSDGTTTYAPGATVTVGANNMTLTAQWSVASYTIRYSLNGGTGTIPSPTSYNFGASHTIAAGVTKANSNFIGWSNGSNTYSAGAAFTLSSRDETFTAQFSGAIYALSFNLNGAETGTVPSTITGQITDNFILPTSAGIAKTGYTFGGWRDGSTTYTGGQTITGVSANTTLTAIWTLLPPAALSAPVATPGDHAGTVTVTPPSLATGGQVTSYKIVATDASGAAINPEKSCTVNAPATSCVITGLTNGTTYKFIATATNAAGSTTSSPSNAIVPASIPGAPTAVTATRGDETATVAFTPPTDNGGSIITSYTLTVVETGQTFTGNGSPITVTGLTNGSSYTFKVSATNAVGVSDSSTASAPVKIAGVADAPTSVTAVAGDETATVSASGNWNTLSGSGGESVTAIVFTSMNGLHTCTATLPATSCTISGLTNGTAYTFTAIAQNAVGNSPGTSSTSVTPAGNPTAPTSVTAIAGDKSATITFSGAGNNGSTITSYIIKVSPTGDTFTVSSSPAVISGLTNGGSYTFTVAAVNAIGESVFSTTSASAVPASAPAAPTSLAVLSGDTSTVVSWSPPSDDGGNPITSYLVTASNGATCTAIAPATSCKITGLTNGTSYTFTAQAINSIGTGSASATSPASVPAGLPTPPTSLSATIGDGQATIAFSGAGTNGSSITTYTVIAKPGGATSSSSASPITVLGLTNGTQYTFRVIATNGVGDSESSTATATATPARAPDAPTSVSASGGNRSAQVSWTPPSNNGGAAITGYTVTASPGGATCSAIAIATSCFVGGLTNGSTYSFTVVANNAAGSSVPSGGSNSVTPLGPPSAPTLTEVVRGDAKATITFNAPSNDGGTSITQYVITAQPGGLSITTGSTTAEFTGLTNGVAYTFTVAAENGVGRGANSNGIVGTPAGTPNAPTVVTGTPGNRSVNLEFSGATGNGAAITGYIITVVETGETRSVTSSPIRFGSLTNGDPYTFTVTTVTSVGESSPSLPSLPITPEQVNNVSSAPSSPAPSAPMSGGASPVVPAPTPEATPAPTPEPSTKPTSKPEDSAKPTPTPVPTVKPTPSPTPSVKPTPSPTPSVKPTPKPSPKPSSPAKPSPKSSSTPTPNSTKKPLAINPPSTGTDKSKGAIKIENLLPGQKIKVTVVEGKSSPSVKATPKVTPKATPKPSASGSKTKSDAPVKVVPKPSGSSAGVGINNLKPGQKIKVTVKTGGTKK